MKESKWIRHYRNEQEQIHMPDTCRMKLLEQISHESDTGTPELAEPVYIAAPGRHRHIGIAVAVAVFLAVVGAVFTVQLRQPASQVSEVQDVQIPLTATRTTDVPVQTAQENTVASDDRASIQMPIETKADLVYHCLYSILFLDRLSGSMTYCDGGDMPCMGNSTFVLDFAANQYYGVEEEFDVNTRQCTQTRTKYNDNGRVTELLDYHGSQENTYSIDPDGGFKDAFWDGTPSDPAATAAALQQGHENVTTYADPAVLQNGALCYLPQDMTRGYLEDLDSWEIVGTKQIQGRMCVIVQGSNPEYGRRFGVETFEILVDQLTGVWMQYEGYDAEGTVRSYIYTQNMFFDESAESVPQFTMEAAEGYTFTGVVSHVSPRASEEVRLAFEKEALEAEKECLRVKAEQAEDAETQQELQAQMEVLEQKKAELEEQQRQLAAQSDETP